MSERTKKLRIVVGVEMDYDPKNFREQLGTLTDNARRAVALIGDRGLPPSTTEHRENFAGSDGVAVDIAVLAKDDLDW